MSGRYSSASTPALPSSPHPPPTCIRPTSVGWSCRRRASRMAVRSTRPILGTSPDAIDLAEDRDRFKALVDRLGLKQPQSGIARNLAEARSVADKLGYPVMIRPSYVLGGRAMEIVADGAEIDRYVARLSC